jgi:CRISPR-associated Csx2 family protein
MAKRFISFLGVSHYTPCNYVLRDARVDAVQFVQTALLHLVASDFSSNDSVLIGCTAKASQANLEPLRSEVFASGWAGPKVDTVDLPDATSEQEMWEIFETLMEQVSDDDELIFDITHSFRSLPMLFTVLIQYLRVVKRIRLRGVYYGAFERLGNPRAVDVMPMADRDAPIIELTPFLSLFDWGSAIDHFLRFGHADELQALVADRINPVLRDSRGRDHSAKALRDVVSNLSGFATGAQFARGKVLTEIRFQSRIAAPLQEIRGDFMPPLQPVLDDLAERFRAWPDRDPVNVVRSVGWCIDHGMVQQGLTLLQEGLVDVLAARLGEVLASVGADAGDPKSRLIQQRTLISKLLNVLGRRIPSAQWKHELERHRDVAESCAARMPPALPAAYERLTQLRNDINHAGFVDARSAGDLCRGLEASYQDIWAVIGESESSDQVSSESMGRTYFVSRHPAAIDWAAEEGIPVDAFVAHLDPDDIRQGDTLIGSLPVNLAAQVCERGARYLHLSLELPPELRGRELTVEEMRACGARLQAFRVEREAE